MSKIELKDMVTTGYFLPEDTQLRLKQLREYVTFLSNLARPRRPDEDNEWYAEIRTGEVAICLELLAEQITQVLDELSYPAERGDKAAAPEVTADAEPEEEERKAGAAYADADDTEPESAIPLMNDAGKHYVSGVTLDQIDELARLGDILRAHGDVVVATDQANFAAVTLSIMGDAIIRDAERLRDIMRDINCGQRLDEPLDSNDEVQEEAAIYLATSACRPLRVVPHPSTRRTVVEPLGACGRTPALAYVGLGV
jgi:hypothetical protein